TTPDQMHAGVNIQSTPTLNPPTHPHQGQQLPQQTAPVQPPSSPFGQMQLPPNPNPRLRYHDNAASGYLFDPMPDSANPNYLQYNNPQADPQSASGVTRYLADTEHDFVSHEEVNANHVLGLDPPFGYDFDDGGVMEGLMKQMDFPMAGAGGIDPSADHIMPDQGFEPWSWVSKDEMYRPIVYPQFTTPREQATVVG
ncbi:hypothetical protein LTR78_006434, partial [Recurvomyces mirabilis]